MVKQATAKIVNGAQDLLFKNFHSKRLIYNACWEDPRIDRQLLALDQQSKVVMITSAGCNALDYLLDSPQMIHAIDMNPRQNALLHLKLSLIERGDFDDLFAMFGNGFHPAYERLYSAERARMPAYARTFWDEKIRYFDGSGFKKSFYYNGTSGDVAWLIRQFLKTNKTLKQQLLTLLEAGSLEEQKEIYRKIEPELWTAFARWLVRQPLVLAMLGVPTSQSLMVDKLYPDGVAGYVRAKMKQIATEVPVRDNYFWRVYLTGSYTQTCCPNYLKPENLALLQANSGNVRTHVGTLTQFLKRHPGPYTHFVLLDHQDWLARHKPEALCEEWGLILKASQPGSKILLRSAALNLYFLPETARASLRFFPEKTGPLHRQDRVGTYASLHLAEVL